MQRRASFSLSIFALGLAACTAPGIAGFTSFDEPPEPAATTAPGSTSIAPAPTTSAGETTGSTTEEPGASSTGEGSSGAVEPAPPPTIVMHTFGPQPLEHAGPISALINTANADSVHMQVDAEEPIALSLAEPNSFVGEIALYSALANGDHKARFVASREALESAPLVIPFKVALPAPGSESLWESDSGLGVGSVVALAVTPDDTVVELGTYFAMGEPRCYLRRRDLGGAWAPVDLFKDKILPNTLCSATDLAVGADGEIYVLVDKVENDELRWWLGRIDDWDAPPTNIGFGAPDELARALASDPTRIAVCGAKQVGSTADATAWIFTPNKPGNVLSFDYVPEGKGQHSIREIPRDCVFSDTRLVLAGTAWGEHDLDNIERDRHFILEIDVGAGQPLWIVAGPDSGAHSQAHAITIDPQGRYITGGQSCDEACSKVNAEFRLFLPGNEQIWHRYIAPGVAPPREIAWSPAGYFVFVSGMEQGPNDSAFLAQAWVPLHGAYFWSYDHHDGPAVQTANALAIGPYGQVYAGGMGAGGFPAVAIIAP